METIPLFISEQIEEGSCEIACLAPRVVYTESAEVSPDIAYLPPKLSKVFGITKEVSSSDIFL